MQKIYQVFIGCPFMRAIRKNYDKLKTDLENEVPLHFILADTTAISSTDYLLEHITTLIRESAGCIFDATGGNPNVSLEVGIAHAMPADFLISLYTRRPRQQKVAEKALASEGEVKPIISDLQGRNRIEYRTYSSLKEQVISRYLRELPYMKRWFEFKNRNGALVPHALRIFKELRASGRTVRPRVIAMLDGTGIAPNDLLGILSEAKLLTVRRGRTGGISYPIK
jgi:hypothetical protein